VDARTVPIEAVKRWLGDDLRAALDALERMPFKPETHPAWCEVLRNLRNAKTTIAFLDKLAGGKLPSVGRGDTKRGRWAKD